MGLPAGGDDLFLHITGNRFTADRDRVGCCVSIAARGTHLSRTGTITGRLITTCRRDAVISAILYLSNARIVNAYLTGRLAGSNFTGVGTRRAVCIVAPRCADNDRVVLHSGLTPVIENGRILVLSTSVAANCAIRTTVRTIGCCNNAITNLSTVFTAARRYLNVPIASVFSPSDLPSCTDFSDHSYPVYGTNRRVSTLIGDFNCSTL